MTATASQFSLEVDSVPVIMIHFNVKETFMVPSWIVPLSEYKRNPIEKSKRDGMKILEAKRVKMQNILNEIEKLGFVPLRFVVVERFEQTSTRMALVCAHKDVIKPGERRIPYKDEAHIRGGLLNRFWDVRVYRNPGTDNSNFVVEAGNPKSPAQFESMMDLVVDEETKQFKLTHQE